MLNYNGCSNLDGTSFLKLNREIDHENVVALKEVLLEDKSIYMVFEYAEHDFLVRSFPS
jgi:cyclin-dependent kinase 8/11